MPANDFHSLIDLPENMKNYEISIMNQVSLGGLDRANFNSKQEL